MLYLRSHPKYSEVNSKLFIVDTSEPPSGVFVRDLDLIKAFEGLDAGLDSLGNLERAGLLHALSL